MKLSSATNSRRAFTLLELLVVIGIIGILAGLLLPVLSRGKATASRVGCLSNQRQLGFAWELFAGDSDGNLVPNEWVLSGYISSSTSNSWVTGNCAVDTDPAQITNGALFPYVKDPNVYKCPADHGLIQDTKIQKFRSFSLSCYMNGPAADITDWGFQPLNKITQIRNTSQTLTFIDEDNLTIDDGHFLYASNVWLNIPGWRHQNGTILTFADAHAEYWQWKGAHPTASDTQFGGGDPTPWLQDIARLQQTAPDSN